VQDCSLTGLRRSVITAVHADLDLRPVSVVAFGVKLPEHGCDRQAQPHEGENAWHVYPHDLLGGEALEWPRACAYMLGNGPPERVKRPVGRRLKACLESRFQFA